MSRLQLLYSARDDVQVSEGVAIRRWWQQSGYRKRIYRPNESREQGGAMRLARGEVVRLLTRAHTVVHGGMSVWRCS